ncbi:MAG: hypothetical protein AcusKO_47820 [Acuticoccus sp.]
MAITTLGDGSKGIFAQSVGGGGGSAGVGIKGDVSGGSDDDDTKQVSFGLGLSGARGGSGGTVVVTNSGAISTGIDATGGADMAGAGLTGADAIFAQSIGGGGGDGGTGVQGDIATASKKKAQSLTVGISASGANGGAGGLVTVTNSGTLSATGNGARGILAQSIGGGGGNGGMGIDGGITSSSDATAEQQIDLGVGGSAGAGGFASSVYVDNSGAITTQPGSSDDAQGQMHGILAQSIGGGGGNGGVGVSGDIKGAKTTKALNVAVGGGGGVGGDGASGAIGSDPSQAGVGVSNSAAIGVLGDGSVGIFAQNIGGGGGNGAAGLAGTVDSGDGKAVTFSLGATGGDGGTGGTVFVANSGAITTGSSDTAIDVTISQAHGIFAQSIGGGGGTGQLTGSLLYGSTSSGTEKGVAFTVGGTSGGGDGGEVLVEDTGSIITHNNASHAIYAQSIGGGGGLAGDLGGIGTDDASNTWDAAIAIGGGGGDGDGATVTVSATGSQYATGGDGSFAIYAQSVGGGGGAGGDGAGLSDTDDDTQTTKNAKLAINVGGQGGSTGDGGAVSVTVGDDTAVSTAGTSAIAVMAQSIGGGGGVGGAGATGLSGTVTVGGSGSSSGNGDAVTVSSNGTITTVGDAAHGIVTQSIGGGGGYAGTFSANDATFGSALDMALDTETTGDGGAVDVVLGGSIATDGAGAVGILAQSVGGGGGVAGYAGSTATGALVGSSGGSGKASAVTVTLLSEGAAITTKGAAAHGIVAQSAGGSGTDTTTRTMVSVDALASVITEGAGSNAIFAQSVGDGRGVVTIEVGEDATIQGGSDGGAGILVADGTANTVENSGTITNVDGVDGIALAYSGDGSLTLTNSGSYTGKLVNVIEADASPFGAARFDTTFAAAAGRIVVFNERSGVFEAGGQIDADRFVNRGRFSSFGDGRVGVTSVRGDFKQTASGVLAVDIDTENGGAVDTLVLGGDAVLDGKIEVGLTNAAAPVIGARREVIVAADGEITSADSLTMTRSIVAQYRLLQSGNRPLRLGYHIDFANGSAGQYLNTNQKALTGHLQALYQAAALDVMLAENLLSIEDAISYAAVINNFSTEIAIDNQLGTVYSTQRFDESLLSCASHATHESKVPYFDDGRCVFAAIEGRGFDRSATSDNVGFTGSSWALSAGGQLAFGDVWNVGGAFAYEQMHIASSDTNASSESDHIFAGLSVKRRFGAFQIGASQSFGYGSYDIVRNPYAGLTVTGDQPLWSASSQLRAAYLLERGKVFFKPRIDLGYTHVFGSNFVERGSDTLAFQVSAGAENYWSIQPALEIGAEFEAGDGIHLRPRLTVGLTQYLNSPEPSLTARIAGAPPGAPAFVNTTKIDTTRFDITAGLDVFAEEKFALRASGFTSLSNHSGIFGGDLRLEVAF